MTGERVCVTTHEVGITPVLFRSSDTLDAVAGRFHHDRSSNLLDVKTTAGGGLFIALPLNTELARLRDEGDLEGDGSGDNPFIVRVERAGAAAVGAGQAGAGSAGAVAGAASGSAQAGAGAGAGAAAVSGPLKTFLEALGKGIAEVKPAVITGFYQSNAAILAASSNAMTPAVAKKFLTQFSSFLNTSTKVQVQSTVGYRIDGIVGQGQAKSSLHVAFRDADVVCVKAYAQQDQSSADREGDVSRLVHDTFSCTTIVEVERVFEAGQHVLVVMPLLGKSAAELLKYSASEQVQYPVTDRAAAVIGLSVLSAIAALAQLEYCHGDIKPANIMLHTHLKDCAVLIDLASCTRYGGGLTECTTSFGLGLAQTAALGWDITCLASTLYMLSASAGGTVCLPNTVQELRQVLSSSDTGSLGCRLCRVLLETGDIAVDDLKEKAWDPCINIVKSMLGSELASALEARWPVRKQL